MAEQRYDIIIIGAGPNGLEMGAYLSKAGLKVLLLEKRHETGGGLATEAVTLPDYIHNTHAVYMMMVDYAPVYSDLKLEADYDVRHIYPSLQFALPLSDGKCVCLYSDLEKTCNSFARFSKRDADSYREFYHMAERAVSKFIGPATYVPAVPALDQLAQLQQTEVGREIAEFSEKTPQEMIDESFENEHIKAMMLYVATKWGVPYDQGALGYLPVLYINRASNYRLVVGGSHMVAQALHKIIHENGGKAWTNQRLKRIIVDGGVAKGVELEDGTIIQADKAVVSTIDPHQTFLKLVGKENLSNDFVEQVEGWMWEKSTLMGLHLALEEAPNFTAAAADPEINRAFIYILGYETTEQLINDYDTIYDGKLPDQANFNCSFPSIHDPLQAPPGRHTGILTRFAPYRLQEGPEKWYDLKFKEAVAEQYLVTLQRYAPNLTRDKVLWHYLSTPIDMENKFADMVEASYKQGLYHPLQMGYLRPNEECSQYRTPIKNLYVAGSSCYPGGCVIWGPGYTATNTLVEDLGIDKWWSEPEMVATARKEGLL